MIETIQILTNLVLAGMAFLQVILLYSTFKFATFELRNHRDKLKVEEERKFVFELINDFREYDFYNQLIYLFKQYKEDNVNPTLLSIQNYVENEEKRIKILKDDYSEKLVEIFFRIEQNTWLLDKYEEIIAVKEARDYIDGKLNGFDCDFKRIKDKVKELSEENSCNQDDVKNLVDLCHKLPKGLNDRKNDNVCYYIAGIRVVKQNLKSLL